ncbi:MAG: ATP-binding cassette domain-containing protein [Acidobacteria bacterium]|jgi:ABC-2 type transport system ATP-binding protein|nr:ATP-binding cassette domain-containing protein [Acidobacteriota bacterium]
MSSLAFEGITKSYGEKRAVDGVSFQVPAGEVFGLLGPNGAGKTTLIRILMDIIRADAGTVTLFGRPLDGSGLDRVGYLPEERGLYKKQKVADVMAYFGTLKGMHQRDARRRALEWLARIGMPEVAHRKVESLSKGMAQKVQIATTFLHDPELAVLDEPFSGLDPINVLFVRELIVERRRAGRTTILSAHQMNLVEELCDRVALIHQGRLMVYGPLDEVRERWSLPEVIVAVRGELPPAIEGAVYARPDGDGGRGCGSGEAIPANGLTIWRVGLADGTAPAELLARLVRAGIAVESFEKALTPLEEIFIRVVQGAAPGGAEPAPGARA